MSDDRWEDEQEEEEEKSEKEVPISQRDYTGLIIERWAIIKKIDRYNYKMQCRCGRLYIRNICSLLSRRASRCFLCHKKKLKNFLWHRTKLD